MTLNGATKYGGVVASPVFKEITVSALRALNVPQDAVELPPVDAEPGSAPADVAEMSIAPDAAEQMRAESDQQSTSAIALGPKVPSFLGKPIRTVIEEAAAQGLRIELSGAGMARYQEPAAGTRLMSGQRIQIRFER